MTTTNDILSEVRGILDDKPSVKETPPEPRDDERIDEASQEHYDAAAKLIEQGAAGGLRKMIDKKLDEVDAEFKKAQKGMEGMKRAGAGRTEAPTLLKPALKKLRAVEQFIKRAVDHGNKATGLHEGIEFAQQGNGLWEEPVVGSSITTPNNSVSGPQSANKMLSAKSIMGAKPGKVVKVGGVAYKVAQPPVALGRTSVVTLGGAYGGGRGDQYAMLVPPNSSGRDGTIKLVNISSATPTFRDLRPDLTVEDEEGDTPLASQRTDSMQVWTPADPNEVADIVRAVYSGPELKHHTEDQETDPPTISAFRTAVREGRAVKVEGQQVPAHVAATALTVYDGLGIDNQRKMGAMSIGRVLQVVEQIVSDDGDYVTEAQGGLKPSSYQKAMDKLEKDAARIRKMRLGRGNTDKVAEEINAAVAQAKKAGIKNATAIMKKELKKDHLGRVRM